MPEVAFAFFQDSVAIIKLKYFRVDLASDLRLNAGDALLHTEHLKRQKDTDCFLGFFCKLTKHAASKLWMLFFAHILHGKIATDDSENAYACVSSDVKGFFFFCQKRTKRRRLVTNVTTFQTLSAHVSGLFRKLLFGM